MKTLGKFEIIEKIGQGAMGMVYKARDPFIGRLVALKTITTGLSEDANLLDRFYQEARSAGTLAHPNIVTIFELGKEGETPFIAMEFIEGGSLDKLIEKRVPMSMAQKVGYVVQICRALEYAHSKGVVHRDIKPGNVMVTTEGGVKVVDFGIARLVGSGKTQTGLLIGTLGYMSPQQIRGKPADARSDIWAVGIMFDELLTGERPFGGENHADLMMNILTAPLTPVTTIVVDVPIEVEQVIGKMLQREIEKRYQSMQEVLIDLNPIWERLLGEEVSRLLASARQLFDDGNLTQARELANRAFQHDTTNVRAKTLLEKIDSEDRRRRVGPQVKALVEKGQNYLSTGRAQEAKAAAEEARQLNSLYQPALDLSAQADAQMQREARLNDAVRTGIQRLAVGELAEAEAQLAKALEIDPASPSALDLQRRIQEEKARRERQKRLSEIKHQARTLWSELRYDESIDLLAQARAQFPGDPEIDDLLDTARQDKADHERQAVLTEARGLLGAERFDDAVKLLDRLLSESPSEPTALNLRVRAIQGRDRLIRQQHLRNELESLQALIKDGKYQEAIGRGQDLLRRYPKEPEIEELLKYARTELAQQERKQRREQWLDRINRGIASEKYGDAAKSAEMALEQFPGDEEFKNLQEKAKELKAQRDRAELISRRVSEVRTKIRREEFTDAISIAQQTIANFGNDTDVAQLLNEATFEMGVREKKKQTQQETIQAAQTMVDSGDPAGATRVLDEAFATKILSRSDPHVTAILQRIDERKVPPPAPPSAAKPSSAPASPSWTAPSQEPGKDYVYQQAPNLSDLSPSVPQDASMIFSPAPLSAPSVQPIPASPTMLPETKTAPEQAKPKRQKQVRSEPEQMASATTFAQPAPSIAVPGDATLVQPAVAEPPTPPIAQPPAEVIPQHGTRPFWMQPAGIALVGVLVLGVGGTVYFLHSSKKPVADNPAVSSSSSTASSSNENPKTKSGGGEFQPQPSVKPQPVDPMAEVAKKQDDLMAQAAKIAGSAEYDGAIAKLNDADGLRGPRTDRIAILRKAYTEDKNNHALADLRQKEQGLWDSANGDFNKGDLDQSQTLFQQITGLPDGGVYKTDAQTFISTKIPARRDALRLFDAATQASKSAKDLNAWQQVGSNVQKALAEGLDDQHTGDAQRLLDSANANVKELQGELDSFNRLVAQFNDPSTQNNKQALQNLLDGFRTLAGGNGPYKQQASDYATKTEAKTKELEARLNPPQPPPQPPSPQPPVAADPQAVIRKVFDDLSGAFAHKDLNSMRADWPSMPAADAKTLTESFRTAKTFSRNFNPSTIGVNGDSATVSGTYSGEFAIGSKPTPSNGSFQASLKKDGNHWIIIDLKM